MPRPSDYAHLSKIHPNLFLTNIVGANDSVKQTTYNIRSIVCTAAPQTCSNEMFRGHHRAFPYTFPDAAMSCEKFEQYVRQAAKWIHEEVNTGPTVVHCYAGINRSVASIVAYGLLYRGKKVASMVDYIRYTNKEQRNEVALINPSFMACLQKMENNERRSKAQAYFNR
jgi:predicted protein tyrosine phosphatase